MTASTDHIIVAIPGGWQLRCGEYYRSDPLSSVRQAQMLWQSRVGRSEFAKLFPITAAVMAAQTKDKPGQDAPVEVAAA